jgi:hypothetical protein
MEIYRFAAPLLYAHVLKSLEDISTESSTTGIWRRPKLIQPFFEFEEFRNSVLSEFENHTH